VGTADLNFTQWKQPLTARLLKPRASTQLQSRATALAHDEKRRPDTRAADSFGVRDRGSATVG